jgi:hypothetical protein
MRNLLPTLLACSLTALAQQPDPLDAAIQAAAIAHNSHFQGGAPEREHALSLLEHVPADSPRLGTWAQQVANLYVGANLNGEARSILESALTRIGTKAESNPSRFELLNALGESWKTDGSLVKAAGYLEQAAAAPIASNQPVSRVAVTWFSSGSGRRTSGSARLQTYLNLADIYHTLGRPDAMAALAPKIAALGPDAQLSLAQSYTNLGKFDEAAAIFRDVAEHAADPQTRVSAWQSLASGAARQQHSTDAVAAMENAIAAVQSSDRPPDSGQLAQMRQMLAGYLASAGSKNEADQIYQQLLQETGGGSQPTQMMSSFAQYLGSTQRAAQGEAVLQEYLAANPSLDRQQEANLLFMLANLASQAGDPKSPQYRDAARDLQPAPAPVSVPPQATIGDDLQKALAAANQNQTADAYRLAVDAIDHATYAIDGTQIWWNVPQIAQALAFHEEPAKAEQLYQRLFTVMQTWKPGSMQPLLAVTQRYVGFLQGLPARVNEAPGAIEEYRRLLIEANGPDSATLAEPLRMTMELASSQSNWPQAEAAARELLEFQESVSGDSSEPYLNDLQAAAHAYGNNPSQRLPLLRKAIVLSDLHATPFRDYRGAEIRMETAVTLAFLSQFDEAETLGGKAVALNPGLQRQLEQIRKLERTEQGAHAPRP